MDYKQFQAGQKVRTQYGEVRTVLLQIGCQVLVEEECNSHYHPSKLSLIEKMAAFKQQE